MTRGEKIKTTLGLDGFKYVVFERILDFPVKAILIYYDSRNPNIPLTNDYLHRKYHFASVRKPPYTRNLPCTPILKLEDYDSGSDPAIIFVVDVGGDLTNPANQIPRRTESEERVYQPRLTEWMTLKNLNTPDAISAFTKRNRDIRSQVLGPENTTAKLINCVYDATKDCLTFIFKTDATTPIYPKNTVFKKTNPTLNYQLSDNPDKVYYTHIRVLDFMKWLKDTRPDELADQPITWREIKDVLEVAFVQLYCSCPAWNWQGSAYACTQVDAAIWPQTIKPKFWDKIHGDMNFMCKHMYGIVRQIGFFGNQMASMANKELKKIGRI